MAEDKNNNNTLGKVAAGAAVVGGVIAAVALSNKDNRDKIKDAATDVKDKVKEKVDETADNAKQKAAETGVKALAAMVVQYQNLKQRIDDVVNTPENKERVEELRNSAERISDSLKKAQSEGEQVAQNLVDEIKQSLNDLTENLNNVEKENA